MTRIATTRRRPLLLAAATAAALLTAGCGGTRNRGLESVHQPVVSRTDYAIDLATPAGDLPASERQRLAGWLAGLRLGYGDRVAVDDPAMSPRVRDRVAAVVAEHGLLLADGAPVTPSPIAPNTARIVVSRMSAAVPGCPDWSRKGGSDFNQNTWSNYGCSVNSNLAAMIANPGDLVRGEGMGRNDPATATKAIELYRKATPTGGGGTTVKAEASGGK